jgi:hypothetical protein
VGRDGLQPRGRKPSARRREAQRSPRPQDHLPDRSDRVRRRLGHRWCGDELHDPRRCSSLPGRVQRRAGADVAGAPDHLVHLSERPGQSARHLRRDRRGWRRDWPASRRRTDRLSLLALDALHQPRLRWRRVRRRNLAARSSDISRQVRTGCSRPAVGLQWTVLHRVRLLERSNTRLAFLRNVGNPRRWSCSARAVRDLDRTRSESAPARAHPARSHPRWRIHLGLHLRSVSVRDVLLPDLLPAADAGLLADQDRPRLPAELGRPGDRSEPCNDRLDAESWAAPGCVFRIDHGGRSDGLARPTRPAHELLEGDPRPDSSRWP